MTESTNGIEADALNLEPRPPSLEGNQHKHSEETLAQKLGAHLGSRPRTDPHAGLAGLCGIRQLADGRLCS